MQADIGGRTLMIAHLPRRHARARLFSASGRGALIAAAVVAALLGLCLLGARANSTPSHAPAASSGINR